MCKWYKLDNFRCPVEGCASPEAYTWICVEDRTDIYIAQTGYMRCSRCPVHIGQISNWRFYCTSHEHGTAHYMEADTENFTFALSAAIQFIGRAGSAWVSTLIENIARQYNRYEDGRTHDALGIETESRKRKGSGSGKDGGITQKQRRKNP